MSSAYRVHMLSRQRNMLNVITYVSFIKKKKHISLCKGLDKQFTLLIFGLYLKLLSYSNMSSLFYVSKSVRITQPVFKLRVPSKYTAKGRKVYNR